MPAGVVHVVTGDAVAIGGELSANRRVRKLTFTGSTQVGKLLYQQSAATMKKLSLELGGNAPFIVFDDADLDQAVEGAVPQNIATAGRRVSAQTGSMCKTVSMTSLLVEWPNARAS